MRIPSRFAILAFCCITTVQLAPAWSQEPSAEEKKELLANQRFEEILKKKPRPGTALDRVYEFHISRGSLDQFCENLQSQATEKHDGSASQLLGLIQSRRGKDAEARAAFEKAEELLPQDPLASYQLGKTLLLIGDTDGAIAALQRAIDRKPEKADSLQIFQELGRVYQRLRRADDALNVWKRMEAMFPGDLQVQEQIANVLEEEGANAAALERFTALATATKDRFRQVELGVRAAALKIKLNQHAEALSDFEKLLSQINPGSWLHQEIRRRIDESFQARQDTAGLTAYYQRWIENHPDDIDAMMRVGRLLSIAHNSAAAKEWFNRAITRAPSAVEPRLALVEAFQRDGNLSAAATTMQALSELQPDNVDYLVRWGELLQGDYTQPEVKRAAAAADVWRRLLNKHNDNPVMVARVADLMRSVNLSEDAIKLYTRAVELADSEPQYREYLGEYLHRLGRKEEAMKVWNELAAGPRRNRDNLVRLSEVLATFGFKTEALAAMAEACQMQPTFAHRLRYSEKLVEAERHLDALAQLQLASQQATGEEEQDQILEREIKVHIELGDMAARIRELEAEVAAGEGAKSVAAWKRLALYQEQDGKTQLALGSINEALKLAPQSATVINLAARIQEKAGLMGDAVSSLRKLIALDRRGQSRILMQIASMYVRLGQTDQAIKTAGEMLSAADAGTEQYRYYADLCFQAGKVDQGLDALRRNLRANPNDREAIELLARALSNNFKTDEAIELTWRSFAKANNRTEKTQVVQTLAELYLRSNSFDELVKRLEAYGREENRGREATILTAAAHQASGDLMSARQLLEPLLSIDSRDSELLTTLIELARADSDWDAAANFQTKLNNLSPTPEGGMQLAKFLLEKGDIEQAESIWNKFAGQKMSADDMQNNMQHLLQNDEIDMVLGMIDRALKNSPDDWETLAVCMQMLYRCEKDAKADEVAKKILQLSLAGDTLSESTKRQRSRQAASPQSTTNSAGPRSSSPFAPFAVANSTETDPFSCVTRASQAVQILITQRQSQMGWQPQLPPAPPLVCFSDARYMALYFSASRQNQMPKDPQQLTAALLEETNRDKLWEMAFLMNAMATDQRMASRIGSRAPMISSSLGSISVTTSGGVQQIRYGVNSSSNMTQALKRLSDLDDRDAQSALIRDALLQRQLLQSLRQSSMRSGRPTDPMKLDPNTILDHWSLVKKVTAQPGSGQNSQFILLCVYLAGELKSLDRHDDSDQLLKFVKQHAPSVPSVQMASALLDTDMEAAIDIFLATVKQSTAPASSTVNLANPAMDASGFLNELLDRQRAIAGLETNSASAVTNRSNPLRLITELKKLQADKARRMRPSQLSAYSPSNPARFMVTSSSGLVGTSVAVVPFPAPSALQSSELLVAMYLINRYPNNLFRDELEKQLRAEAAQPDDDAMQSAVDHLCLSVWLWWSEQREEALKELEIVRQTAVVNDLVSMLASRMYFEGGQVKEALSQLQALKPTTSQLMQDRELAILQLASQAGDTELAKQAAERLFAMRLQPQVQSQVANFMQQLGMSEMAGSMRQRMQRRGGNQLVSLIQLMNQYQQEKKSSAAQEIARQILRRTRSSRPNNANTNISPFSATRAQQPNSNESYRKQALKVLADAPETKQQIEQLEEKIKNNPKSSSLIYQLAELYEATGRAADSTKLLAQLQTNTKAASQANVMARLNTFRQTRSADSVKGYLEIFEQHPELIARESAYFQMAVQQHKGWDTLATTLSQWPIDRLTQNGEWVSILQMTILRASKPLSEKLVLKLLEPDDFLTRFDLVFARFNNRTKWSDEVQTRITERLIKALTDPAFKPTSTSQSLLAIVNNLVSDSKAARQLLDTIAPLSADRPDLKCLEVLLFHLADDQAGAQKAFEQVRQLKMDTQNLRHMSDLANTLVMLRNYEMAIALLEGIDSQQKSELPIQYSPRAVLLGCYEAVRNFEKAKPLLDATFADLQKQPSAPDPFGGNEAEYYNATNLAQRYLTNGNPFDAFAVLQWVRSRGAVSPEEMMMGGMGGSMGIGGMGMGSMDSNAINQLTNLEKQVKEKLGAKSIGQLIRIELQPQGVDLATLPKVNWPVAMLVPDLGKVTDVNSPPASPMQELMNRLTDAPSVKTELQQLLDELAAQKWKDLKPRSLVCALSLADYLEQSETYISAATQLDKLLSAQPAESATSGKPNAAGDNSSLRTAYWLIADKLAQLNRPELARQFATHGSSRGNANNSSSNSSIAGNNSPSSSHNFQLMQLRLRLARSLKDAKQPIAAEMQMRELLDQIYPNKSPAAAAATAQPK